MINKKTQRVNEICDHIPELAYLRYKEIVGEVYSCLIENSVCWRVVKQDCLRSKTEWTQQNGVLKPGIVELCVNNYLGKSVLWDLVHELGHLLILDFGRKVPVPMPWWLRLPKQECARNKEEAQLQLENEKAAWDTAEEWLNVTLALTQGELEDFNSRRNSCLATYKEKVGYFEKK